MAAALAFALTQLAFLGHDAAHRQIFRSGRRNDVAALVLANVLVGISRAWWVSKHARHHANPNKVGADPDIEPGALVFSPEPVRARRPLFDALRARQGWLFFPLLLLEGINLHVSGVRSLFAKGRADWVEAPILVVRLGGYAAAVFIALPPGKAFAFLGLQLGLFGLYMGASFAPNHKGMPIVPKDLKLDFLRRQVLMSRNIRGNRFLDFMMGGLNYQVEHHLFPSMPRPNLRRIQPVVEAFCLAQGVTYTVTTLGDSYAIVVRYLNEVGLRHVDPFACPLAVR